MNCDIAWVCSHGNLLWLWPEFCAPWPVLKSSNVSQISQISRIQWHLLVSTCHHKVLSRMVEVQRNWITRNVSLAEFLLLLSVTIKVVKRLVPASDQTIWLIVLGCYWAPLHAPNWSLQLYFQLLVQVTAPERNDTADCTESYCLTVGAPCWTDDFLSEFLFRNFFLTWSVKSKICGSSTEKFMSQRIEAKSQDGFTLGDFEGRFELSFSFQIEPPNDARAIIAE